MTYQFHEKRNWDSIEFTEQGELLQLEVGIASRGETSLLYTSEVENQTILTHYEHRRHDSNWEMGFISSIRIPNQRKHILCSHFAGKPLILTTSNEDGINLVTASGYVALEQELARLDPLGIL